MDHGHHHVDSGDCSGPIADAGSDPNHRFHELPEDKWFTYGLLLAMAAMMAWVATKI